MVVYTTENSDLYTEEFDDYRDALAFVSGMENKAIIVFCDGLVEIEDHT